MLIYMQAWVPVVNDNEKKERGKDTEKRGRKKGRKTQIKEELFEKFGGIC